MPSPGRAGAPTLAVAQRFGSGHAAANAKWKGWSRAANVGRFFHAVSAHAIRPAVAPRRLISGDGLRCDSRVASHPLRSASTADRGHDRPSIRGGS